MHLIEIGSKCIFKKNESIYESEINGIVIQRNRYNNYMNVSKILSYIGYSKLVDQLEFLSNINLGNEDYYYIGEKYRHFEGFWYIYILNFQV